MKNTSAPDSLKAALAKRLGLEKEISELNTLSADTATRRVTLETTCRLDDRAALDEIARCQTLAALFPARLAAREESLAQAESALLAAAHGFIREALSPRIRELHSRAEAKARASLEPHFTDPEKLQAAIANSSLVVELSGLSPTIDANPLNGATPYAERLLNHWGQAEAIAQKLS